MKVWAVHAMTAEEWEHYSWIDSIHSTEEKANARLQEGRDTNDNWVELPDVTLEGNCLTCVAIYPTDAEDGLYLTDVQMYEVEE